MKDYICPKYKGCEDKKWCEHAIPHNWVGNGRSRSEYNCDANCNNKNIYCIHIKLFKLRKIGLIK